MRNTTRRSAPQPLPRGARAHYPPRQAMHPERPTEELPTEELMERSNLLRQTALFLAVGAWAFLLLALGSFHATDWPSHTVYPWPATQNLCGTAGAFLAYYCFLAIGQGVFPVLF